MERDVGSLINVYPTTYWVPRNFIITTLSHSSSLNPGAVCRTGFPLKPPLPGLTPEEPAHGYMVEPALLSPPVGTSLLARTSPRIPIALA